MVILMARVKVSTEIVGLLEIIRGYMTIKKRRRVTNDDIIKEALFDYAKKYNIKINL